MGNEEVNDNKEIDSNKIDRKYFSDLIHNIIYLTSVIILVFILGISIIKGIYYILQFNQINVEFNISILSINSITGIIFGVFAIYNIKRFKWKFLLLTLPIYALYDIIWNFNAIIHFGFTCMWNQSYQYPSFSVYVLVIGSFCLASIYFTNITIQLPKLRDLVPYMIFLVIEYCVYILPQTNICSLSIPNQSIELQILHQIFYAGAVAQITFLYAFRNIFKEKDIK
jgi:hypothetical protein